MCAASRKVRRSAFLRCLLPLCGLLSAVSGIAQIGLAHPIVFSRHQEVDLSGTYSGHAPANDAAKRVFTLNLAADGTATLNTLYIGKNNATEKGRWKQTGNQIELTFDAMGSHQPPQPIIFRHRDHQLSPIHWDASEWGRSGPPVLHRSPPKSMATGISQAPLIWSYGQGGF